MTAFKMTFSHTCVSEALKRLLLVAGLTLFPDVVSAQPAAIQCPGDTTPEMRYCAEQAWRRSDAQLREKVSPELMQQWQDATKALCAAAYASYLEGTIYPQLVVGCDDNLNRALLKEFRGLGN